MHSSLFLVCFLTLQQSFVFAELSRDRFGLHADKSGKKTDTKLHAPGAKVDLSKGKAGLTDVKVDLSKGKAGLSAGKGGLAKGQVDLSGGKVGSSVDKVQSDLKPFNFTYCFITSRNVFDNSERSDFDEREESKVKFAIEVADDGRRFYLHNYKEQFGNRLSSTNLLASCKRCKPKLCVTWVGIKKEFHLYVEGKHLLGGIGNLEWELLGKIKAIISKGKKAEESLSGPMSDLQHWDRAISKKEAEAFGHLQGDPVEGKSSNWKINAVEITEPYITSCPPPTGSEMDSEAFDPDVNWMEFAAELNKPTQFHELSLCGWIYYSKTENSVDLIRLTGSPSLAITYTGVNMVLNFGSRSWQLLNERGANQWHHICATWSGLRTGTVDTYVDGQPRFHVDLNESATVVTGRDVSISETRHAALDPKNPTKGVDCTASGVDLWDYVLTKEQVFHHYSCSSSMPGNVLDWAKSKLAPK